MERTLRNRLILAPAMLAVLFVVLLLDHLVEVWTGLKGVGVAGLLLVLLPIGTLELATLFTAERVRPYRFIAAVGCWALVIHAFMTQFQTFQRISTSALAFIIVFVMLLAALRRAWARQTQEAILHMAGTVLAMLYLGGLAWFLLALRVKEGEHFTGSTIIILMILVVVKSTDIGAYIGGRMIGRHKLIAWLSPGKTWEGLACGLFTASVVAMACAPFIVNFLWWEAMVFGVVIGGIGQLGDLLESLMKRDAEVKDSSQLFPGMGGVLDVMDSPLLAAPFAYLLLSLF